MRLVQPLVGCALAAGLAGGVLAATGAFGGATPKPRAAGRGDGQILFVGTDSRSRRTLNLMRADGSRRKVLWRASARNIELTSVQWSPDGQHVVFGLSRSRVERQSDVYAFDLSTRRARRVTTTRDALTPSWSPDGRRIAFSREVPAPEGEWQRAEIWTMNPDGSDKTRVTQDSWDLFPAWSPDGRTIAFTKFKFDSKTSTFFQSLHAVPAGGGTPRLLSDHSGSAAWSPDGTRLAVVDERDHNGDSCYDECTIYGELYVMNADGSRPVRLTRTKVGESSPSWSPDGTRILFSSRLNSPLEGNDEIYSIPADGGCPLRLTNDSAGLANPLWRPGTGTGPAPHAGPCRNGYRTTGRKPSLHTDLRAARRFRQFPLYYLGRSFEGLLLTAATGSTGSGGFDFTYDDCGLNPGRCGHFVNVQVFSMCKDHPLVFNPPLQIRSPLKSRRVLSFYDRGNGSLRLWTGRVALSIEVENGPRARRVVAGLRRFGAHGRRRALPRPQFPSSMMRTLRRTEHAYRQLHSLSRVRARLHISKYAIRTYLRLARDIRRLGPARTIHCPKLKPPGPSLPPR
jgi:Tol biopolymer transport system component